MKLNSGLKNTKRRYDMDEMKKIYEKISKVLTEYEKFVKGKGDDSQIYERAADMYEVLIEIQQKFEAEMKSNKNNI